MNFLNLRDILDQEWVFIDETTYACINMQVEPSMVSKEQLYNRSVDEQPKYI